MRLYPECVPCMLKQALEMAKLVTHDRKVLERVLRAGLGILQSERWNVPQPIVAFKLFRKVSELIGVEDPYREIKRQSNRFVMNLYDELEGIIESSKDKLMTAIKLSIAGNIIDYGTGRPFDVDETINRVLRTDFTINHYKLLREDIEKAETIVIFGDNAGEAVFDKLLIEQLGDKKITYFVRAHPFINDVTVIDAEEISLEDIAEIIRQSVQVEEIEYYGKEHLPAGPNVGKSDAIIVVEGRNDVINLLKHGIKNTISVEGTSIPKSVVDLCTEKVATAFVDGDRGGELILKELLQVADIDFVARAPKTREVEELPYKLIMKSLKNKIPTEQYMEMHGIERENSKPVSRKETKKETKKESRSEPKLNDTQKNYKKLLSEVKGTHAAVLLDSNGKELGRLKVEALIDEIPKSKPHTIIFDGITTQRLIDIAFENNVNTVLSTKKGELSKVPSSIKVITEDSLR